MTKPRPSPGSNQDDAGEAPFARVYRAPNRQQEEDWSVLGSCLLMLFAPCVPLTRAVSWISSRYVAAFVLALSATLFIGGIVCAGLAATSGHPFLQIDVVYAFPVGWLMSGIGIFYSLPLDGMLWFIQAVQSADCGDKERPEGFREYSVDYTSAVLTVVHLVSQCGMLVISCVVQCDLNHHAGVELRCCECLSMLCCPCWSFAHAMDRAKRTLPAQAENRVGSDEMPAYVI